MAYRRGNTDRISHLPSEIIEKILILLPCRDAVRTCILSSVWRYKWTSMSDLNFGEPWGTGRKVDRFIMFITQCLLRHQGPIRKFSVNSCASMVARKLERWMQLVWKHDIEELQVYSYLGYRSFRSSSCLFKCKKLTHLKLSNCSLDVPPTFEGFMNLKVLNLSNVDVEDKSSIEILISKSPLLESISLDFSQSSQITNITVSAPKIKYLSMLGFKSFCLQNSPVLGYMRLDTSWYSCDLIKIFGDAPNLLNCKKLTHLDLSGEMLTIPSTFEGFMNLKSLKLSIRKVDSGVESLISKSPLLESLSISNSGRSNITISAPNIKYLSLLGNLESIGLEKSPVLVDMSLFLWGCSRDCNFIKILKILGGAPNLEKLTMKIFQHIESGCYRGMLCTTFSCLKVMTLSGLYLGESKGIPLVIELLTSAPNLEKLVIYNGYSHSPPNEADPDFWQKEYLVGHCFMKLKVVEMSGISCMAPEIEFVKFILLNSPILEKMTIQTREWKPEILTRMLEKLPTLPRASPQVAVTIMTFKGVQTKTVVWTNCSLET